jgi:uncharacterized RDD family membrane protein YckC
MEYKNSRQFTLDRDLYATQGQRFANFIVDYICQLLLMFALMFAITIIALMIGDDMIIARLEGLNKIEEYGIAAVIHLLYYNVFEIFFARTMGKFITNTVVVDINGEKPGSQEILIRSLCRLIPFDAFSFLGAPDKGWHDSISKTYVVKKTLLEDKKKQFYSLDEIGNTTE